MGVVASLETGHNPSCYTGAYASLTGPFPECAGFKICEPGYYCQGGVRNACPGGSYSNETRQEACSSTCPEGYFCPTGSIR
ncbi:unnamed protein product [Chrysoparadoxa australica]